MTSERPERQGRRRGRDRQAAAPSLTQVPWKQPTRHFAPTELATDTQLEVIPQTSLQILEELGMEFIDQEARDLLDATGGVKIEERRVRFDPE